MNPSSVTFSLTTIFPISVRRLAWSSGNQTLAARPASPPCLAEQSVSFAGPPGVILDGFHEVFVDGHGLLLLLIGVVSYRRRRRRGW
jgi:hypothetical protein